MRLREIAYRKVITQSLPQTTDRHGGIRTAASGPSDPQVGAGHAHPEARPPCCNGAPDTRRRSWIVPSQQRVRTRRPRGRAGASTFRCSRTTRTPRSGRRSVRRPCWPPDGHGSARAAVESRVPSPDLGDDHATAYCSVNYHQDHFGRCSTSARGGSPAHSSCIGFGLERWAVAVFATHGRDPDTWPLRVKSHLWP
jgi:hypothetical protein